MKKQTLINQINKSEFVYLKVTVLHNKNTILEIFNSSDILIESFVDESTSNEAIERLQLSMLKKAGEYQNRGLHTIIIPFTN